MTSISILHSLGVGVFVGVAVGVGVIPNVTIQTIEQYEGVGVGVCSGVGVNV